MIELVTGLPGNAKTLFTLAQVKEQAERENRPVFYHGIPELKLPWEQLADPRDWMKVPPNAIVVIDEAQKTFRNRSLGSQPPEFVTALETHRHLGIDLVLLTQHPSLVDPAVRRLAGRHRHLVRIWGMEASTVHRWDAVKDNCDKSRADSNKTRWKFDRSLYGVYKSAEVHTMKRSLPGRLYVMAGAVVALALAAVYVSRFIASKTEASKASVVSASSVSQPGVPGAPGRIGAPGSSVFDPVSDARQYVAMNTPRVVGLPHTAPKYDALTVPVRVPVPAACIQIGSAVSGGQVLCKCYSQQGTPMAVEFNMCIEYARNGYFQDFDAEHQASAPGRPDAQSSRPAAKPDDGSPSVAGVMALADIPESRPASFVEQRQVNDGPPNNRSTRAGSGSVQ